MDTEFVEMEIDQRKQKKKKYGKSTQRILENIHYIVERIEVAKEAIDSGESPSKSARVGKECVNLIKYLLLAPTSFASH